MPSQQQAKSLDGIPVPDTLAARVVELVGQPLMLKKLISLWMKEKWFAAPESNKKPNS